MQTVNFQCGHCNNLMAVTTENLGRQVQCPHCRQIVVAPASADPSPSPPPAFSTDPTAEPESIFSPPASEDLFDSPAPPRLESLGSALDQQTLPLEPAVPAPAGGETTQLYQPPEHAAPTETIVPGPAVPNGEATLADHDQTSAWQMPAEQVSSAPVSEPLPSPAIAKAKARGGTGSNVLLLFFIPLLSYSILATVVIALLYYKIQNTKPNNPLEEMPDVSGDMPGVKKGEKVSKSWTPPEAYTRLAISPNFRVGLNQTLRVGDLEVTPRQVELTTVRVFVEGSERPEPCLHRSLVLRLRLKNVSDEWTFAPLDNFFDRRWKKGDGPPPLTLLEAGSERFVGGPAPWYPLKRSKRDTGVNRREWVEGRKNEPQPLKPGEELDTLVCTDGQIEAVEKTAESYQGNYLWRVHVRRGPVVVQGRPAPVPATAVIGVEFKAEDIVRQ
jgi:hypothetical protein